MCDGKEAKRAHWHTWTQMDSAQVSPESQHSEQIVSRTYHSANLRKSGVGDTFYDSPPAPSSPPQSGWFGEGKFSRRSKTKKAEHNEQLSASIEYMRYLPETRHQALYDNYLRGNFGLVFSRRALPWKNSGRFALLGPV